MSYKTNDSIADYVLCRSLSHNKLFHEHPELVRSLGVHTLVLQLLEVYLGIDQSAAHDKHVARKLKSKARHVSDSVTI